MQITMRMPLMLACLAVAGNSYSAHRIQRIMRHVQSAPVATSTTAGAVSSSVGASLESLNYPRLKNVIADTWGLAIARNKDLIATILEVEEQHADRYYPLYHGQDNSFRSYQDFLRLLYAWEHQTTVPADFTFLRWWHGAPEKADVQEYLNSSPALNDHMPDVSKVLLSVNLSLFGNVIQSGESSLDYFLRNWSIRTFDVGVLQKIMVHYGFNPAYAQKVLDCGAEIATHAGNLVQILVPKKASSDAELIDRMFYISEAGGIPGPYYYADDTLVQESDYSPTKKRYIRSSGVLKARLTRSHDFDHTTFDSMQGRLYVSKDALLNPHSGIKVIRYTTVPETNLKSYKLTLQELFEQMIAEKKQRAQQHVEIKEKAARDTSMSSTYAEGIVVRPELRAHIKDLTSGLPPFLQAYYNGPEAFAKEVAACADITQNIKLSRLQGNRECKTLVDFAVKETRCDVMELLIRNNIIDHNDIINANVRLNGTLRQLIACYGPHINIKDKHGSTVLIQCIKKPDIFLVEVLFHGVKVCKESMECFVRAGADSTIKDNSGRTALLYALLLGNTWMVECLSKHVIDLNAHLNVRNKDGNTHLMLAARAGTVSVVERLIKAGADTTLKNNQGYTALQMVQSSALSGIEDWTKKSIIEKLLEDAQSLRAGL